MLRQRCAVKDATKEAVVTAQAPPERKPRPSIFAADPSKAYCEKVFLWTSLFSLVWFLVGVVGTGLYEYCDRRHYAVIGVLMALPPWLVPALFPCREDLNRRLTERFWFKANLWHAIFGFIGNYFWTHYFFTILGARYTFDSYLINGIPIPCYLATHCYFCFYHVLSTMALRWVARKCEGQGVRFIALSVTVLIMSYVTALMEAVTIAHFPYYDFDDRQAMYVIGSAFYAIYFVVSFPVFWRLDESDSGERSSASQACTESLASGMLVTILLDLWRLTIGSLGSGTVVKIPPFVSPVQG